MKKKYLIFPLLAIASITLCSCNNTYEDLEIELDEFTPVAYVGQEYDFTDVLYVQEGVNYELKVYYQNYRTMEEKTLPVVDTFYFTPIELYDLTVIINATKGKQSARRTRHVTVTHNPEEVTRYNLEMCNFEPGEWRGTGSTAEISYSETYGTKSRNSRKVTFKNSLNLPNSDSEKNSDTVNASFNLATTVGIGQEAGIDSKKCLLSFDLKMSQEFFDSINENRYLFKFKIEDDAWVPTEAILSIVDSISDFTYENTDDGWFHVEQNLYDLGDFDDSGNGTYVITFGFFGISNETRESAYVIFDNIALTDVPTEEQGIKEVATRDNIEMCRFEPGDWRGTGSKAVKSFTELRGSDSTSSRLVTFKHSKDLPDVVDNDNHATVNASFNLANTKSIGVDNEIDAKKCTLSFDIKLSQEFFLTSHQFKHMYSLKLEDENWEVQFTWFSMVTNPDDFTYENTDNGWMHIDSDLSTNSELAGLGNSTYVITFGFFGITSTTRTTASIVFDNIKLKTNP